MNWQAYQRERRRRPCSLCHREGKHALATGFRWKERWIRLAHCRAHTLKALQRQRRQFIEKHSDDPPERFTRIYMGLRWIWDALQSGYTANNPPRRYRR